MSTWMKMYKEFTNFKMCIFFIIFPFWHNLAFFKLAMIFLLLLYDEIRTHVCEQDFARFKLVKTICPVRLCGRAYLLSSKIVFKRCSNVLEIQN